MLNYGFASVANNCNHIFSNAEADIDRVNNSQSIFIGCDVATDATGWKNSTIIGTEAGRYSTVNNPSLASDTSVVFLGYQAGKNTSNVENSVFIGCGPLLYLTAWQYIKAGISIRAVVDTTRLYHWRAAIGFLFLALLQPRMLFLGLKWLKRGHEERLQGLRVFCEHRDPRALPLLIPLLNEPCPVERMSAVYALGRNPCPRALDILLNLLKRD